MMDYLSKLAELAKQEEPTTLLDQWRLSLMAYGTAVTLHTSDGVELIDPADMYLSPTPPTA
jgi:hypothetical protein